MPSFIGPDNPIAWAQFKRKGGLNSMLGVAATYGVIISSAIYLTVRLSPANVSASVYAGWATGLLALQTLFVVVIGAGRVSTTIRQDITSGIIESHRMMPITAGHAIAGYCSAAAAAISGVFLANVLIGSLVSIAGGLPAGRWVMANVILLSFGLFVWTLAAFGALAAAKGPGGIIAVSSLAGFFGNAGLLFVAPALVVLTGPLIGGSIFNLRTAQTDVSLPLILSTCAQVLVGAIFFTGAARKFRRPDAIALGGFLGELLLLAAVGISVLAIVRWEDFQPGFMGRAFRNADAVIPFIGSSVLCLIVAVAALTSFARQHVLWMRHRVDDPDLRPTAPAPIASALIVTATLSLLILASPTRPAGWQVGYTVAAFAGFSFAVIFVAAWTYRAIDNAKLFLAIWLVGHCALPIIADLVRHSFAESDDDIPLTVLAPFSPIGLLIQTWTKSPFDLRPGVAAQLILPLIPIMLYYRDARRKGRTAPTPPPLPA